MPGIKNDLNYKYPKYCKRNKCRYRVCGNKTCGPLKFMITLICTSSWLTAFKHWFHLKPSKPTGWVQTLQPRSVVSQKKTLGCWGQPHGDWTRLRTHPAGRQLFVEGAFPLCSLANIIMLQPLIGLYNHQYIPVAGGFRGFFQGYHQTRGTTGQTVHDLENE